MAFIIVKNMVSACIIASYLTFSVETYSKTNQARHATNPWATTPTTADRRGHGMVPVSVCRLFSPCFLNILTTSATKVFRQFQCYHHFQIHHCQNPNYQIIFKKQQQCFHRLQCTAFLAFLAFLAFSQICRSLEGFLLSL